MLNFALWAKWCLGKQIVLQDLDDGNDTKEHQGNDSTKEDDQVDVVDEDDPQCENEYIDVSRRTSSSVISCADMDEKEDRSAPERAPSDHYPGSNSHASENIASPNEERYL